MRAYLLLFCGVAMIGWAIAPACTGTGDDDTTPTPSFSPTPTDTPPLCDPSPCSEPTWVNFGAQFAVIDGGGSYTADGTLFFALLDEDQNPVCRQQWDFVSDWAIPDMNGDGTGDQNDLQGCDENGGNCTIVCPANEPGAGQTTGQCAGFFLNMVPDASSYETDCSFLNPVSAFHPEREGIPDYMTTFAFSVPVESAFSLPNGGTTWGDVVSDWTTTSGSPYEGMFGGLMVSRVYYNADGSFTSGASQNNGAPFFWGIGFSDSSQSAPPAVGNHDWGVNAWISGVP
jgi:hypothetical protein